MSLCIQLTYFEICFMTAQRNKNWSTTIRCPFKYKYPASSIYTKELLSELLQNFIFWVVTRGKLQYYATAKEITALHISMNIWYLFLFFIPSSLNASESIHAFFKTFENNSDFSKESQLFCLFVCFSLKNDLFFRTFMVQKSKIYYCAFYNWIHLFK